MIAEALSRTVANPAHYFGVALSRRGKMNLTFFRKHPKLAKGKAAVKLAKRRRMFHNGLITNKIY